jgi:hypothetical protein
MALPAHSGPRPLIQFRNHFPERVGLLGRVISQSQGRYLNTRQYKHKINAYTHQTSMPLSGIRTHDPSVRASEHRSWLRPHGYCDQHLLCLRIFFFHWLYSPRGPWPLFQFHDHFTDGRTPWASDQLVARPLPKHRTTQTHNKHIHTPNIHALCRIRTHDPGFRASEDSSCLRPLGYPLCVYILYYILFKAQ